MVHQQTSQALVDPNTDMLWLNEHDPWDMSLPPDEETIPYSPPWQEISSWPVDSSGSRNVEVDREGSSSETMSPSDEAAVRQRDERSVHKEEVCRILQETCSSRCLNVINPTLCCYSRLTIHQQLVRRKGQNRQAQRNFRARKEILIKETSTRLSILQNELSQLQSANGHLSDTVTVLRKEIMHLRMLNQQLQDVGGCECLSGWHASPSEFKHEPGS